MKWVTALIALSLLFMLSGATQIGETEGMDSPCFINFSGALFFFVLLVKTFGSDNLRNKFIPICSFVTFLNGSCYFYLIKVSKVCVFKVRPRIKSPNPSAMTHFILEIKL